jgi:hypothetical protein
MYRPAARLFESCDCSFVERTSRNWGDRSLIIVRT